MHSHRSDRARDNTKSRITILRSRPTSWNQAWRQLVGTRNRNDPILRNQRPYHFRKELEYHRPLTHSLAGLGYKHRGAGWNTSEPLSHFPPSLPPASQDGCFDSFHRVEMTLSLPLWYLWMSDRPGSEGKEESENQPRAVSLIIWVSSRSAGFWCGLSSCLTSRDRGREGIRSREGKWWEIPDESCSLLYNEWVETWWEISDRMGDAEIGKISQWACRMNGKVGKYIFLWSYGIPNMLTI